MRTSITLDDDIYELASLYSRARGVSLGAAIGDLVRRGNSGPSPSLEIVIAPNGLPAFRSRGRVITSEMVKAHQEDEGE